MTVNPFQIIAFQTVISRAMAELRALNPAELEEGARWILDNRGVPCTCGQCPAPTDAELRASEAVASVMVAAAELVSADRHAANCTEAAYQAFMKRPHNPR